MNLIHKPEWAIPEREATPEHVYFNRRAFIQGSLGLIAAGAAGAALPAAALAAAPEKDPTADLYPAKRNPLFKLDRPLTDEKVVEEYNNFYEFGPTKSVAFLAQRLKIRPWQVKVSGHVRHPHTYDIDNLIRSMPLEERLYRHRCVEAWAMAVPWTGFPFSALIKKVEPTSKAKYVKMTTFLDRTVALGQLQLWDPWPYTEGLTIEEAMNELTILGTGLYGHPMPKQDGAPLRLVTPWKYGFKSIKSIVAIEFTEERPKTFWDTLQPNEYGFWANVNPAFAHPRWSQKTERMLGTGKRRPTLIFNGYGKWVAHLYPHLDEHKYFY